MGKCEPDPSVIGYRLVTRAVNLVKQFGFFLLVAMMIVVFWDVIVMWCDKFMGILEERADSIFRVLSSAWRQEIPPECW